MATLTGGTGNDAMNGTTGRDTVYGGAGNDTVSANAGDDSVFGGTGTDLVYGGDGQDVAFGGTGDDTVYGDAGNDTLLGDSGADNLFGGVGTDALLGGSGNDMLDGGTENDWLDGGTGSDSILGGAGNDTLNGDGHSINPGYFPSTGPTDTTLTIGNSASFGIDIYWINTSGVGVFYGTLAPGGSWSHTTGATHNWYVTEQGQTAVLDLIQGAPNQTYTLTGDFNDTLDGGAGDDSINGGYGADSVLGGDGNDTLNLGAGNDTVFGGLGTDTVTLGDGNDVAMGDAGNDTIYGGLGNDTIYGGADNDIVDGGDGDDSLAGGTGNDSLYGGGGSDRIVINANEGVDLVTGGETGVDHDTLQLTSALNEGNTVIFTGSEAGTYSYAGGGSGSFSQIEVIEVGGGDDRVDASAATTAVEVYGGTGQDTLTGGSAADTLSGGDGNDQLYGGAGNDSLLGDAGNDTLTGGSGDDVLFGGEGNNIASGGDGNDALSDGSSASRLEGGTGNDTLTGGAGDDTLLGDAGADQLYGGTGADYLSGGTGNDQITTGSGADHVALTTGGGSDTVFDFDMTKVNGITADQLDVSDLRTLNGQPLHARDISVSDDGNGNARLTFPSGEMVTLIGVPPQMLMGKKALAAIGVPCFARDTRILTPFGARPVQDLRPGDLVQTLDHGVQPILWVGGRQLSASDLAARPDLRPIVIRAGALGNPDDLVLSPQHAVLIRGAYFARARHLAQLGDPRFRLALGRKSVAYHHILLPQHAVVFANGAPCESFYPGRQALAALGIQDRSNLLRLLPGLTLVLHGIAAVDAIYGPTAYPIMPRKRLLIGEIVAAGQAGLATICEQNPYAS